MVGVVTAMRESVYGDATMLYYSIDDGWIFFLRRSCWTLDDDGRKGVMADDVAR
jgi:hypothetical protein